MGFIITAEAFFVLLFGFCFFVNNISLSPHLAKLSKTSLWVSGLAGAVMCVVPTVVFFVLLSGFEGDATVKAVISDSYIMFAVTDGVFIAVGLLVTLVSSFMKSFLRPMIPAVLPMWAAISLFWTLACSVWSEFSGFNASGFVILYGIGAAALLSFSALPQTAERIKVLSDNEKREELIRVRREKSEKKEKKRAKKRDLAQKKRRLRHPKK